MLCKKCNKTFKLKQCIEGKIRNLSNRKFCLECSPFDSHNTKDLTKKESDKTKKNSNKKIVNWRRRTKLKLIQYKGGKCEKCGYDKSIPLAL